MTKRAVSSLLVAFAMVFTAIGGSVANAATECEEIDVGPDGCITLARWSTVIDHDNLVIYRMPAQGSYQDAQGVWEAQFTPYCAGNVAGPQILADGLCQQALLTCAVRHSTARVAMWMVITPFFEGPHPQLEGPLCFGGSSATSFGPQIQALVEEEIGAEPPPILLQPADAIINLPMLASTDPRQPLQLPISDPVSGLAEATPEFTWSFAEGAAAHGPGLPYDGTSPTQNPGYYVGYTYRTLGTPSIDLTVTWRVTFTIPGYPPVPLEDVVRTASATTNIRSATSELIGG